MKAKHEKISFSEDKKKVNRMKVKKILMGALSAITLFILAMMVLDILIDSLTVADIISYSISILLVGSMMVVASRITRPSE